MITNKEMKTGLIKDGEPYGKCRRFKKCSKALGRTVSVTECYKCMDYLK